MANSNEYSELLRAVNANPEPAQRGDDFILAPYENAVAELLNLIDKLDSDAGTSAMNDIRQLILNDTTIPPAAMARFVETLVKDLLHITRRLERSNANYRNKRQGATQAPKTESA